MYLFTNFLKITYKDMSFIKGFSNIFVDPFLLIPSSSPCPILIILFSSIMYSLILFHVLHLNKNTTVYSYHIFLTQAPAEGLQLLWLQLAHHFIAYVTFKAMSLIFFLFLRHLNFSYPKDRLILCLELIATHSLLMQNFTREICKYCVRLKKM